MSVVEAISAMCDGNPGALNVLCDLAKNGAAIDPYTANLGPWHAILGLDSVGIFGSHIWLLYNDVCNRRLGWLIALLRAWGFGYVTDSQLRQWAAEGQAPPEAIVAAVIAKIQIDLPNLKVDYGQASVADSDHQPGIES